MALVLAIPKLSWFKTNSELCYGSSTNFENENRIMKQHSLLLPTIVAAALSLSSCAPEVPRQVAYNEAAFAGYGNSGSGQVAGRAAAVIGGRAQLAPFTNVTLMPLNAYTTEILLA